VRPPDIEAKDDWFAAAEDCLRSTLDKDVAYESITSVLDRLSPPAHCAADAVPDGMSAIASGAVAAPLGEGSFAEVLGSLRAANHASTYAAAGFWWSTRGEGFVPGGLCCRRRPDPLLQARMLPRRFS